ncbi:MAG TPA: nitrophenyl compound nitroreductase subunit ArsF family protein [Bacteroidales bacterium]|nr:nitrophenyl compound nitroreductase subunit ArsF family protein [Bacteroidales bacterium]HRZ49248.1 nitrophenyl compound nitroreductase subunit ArsF family protein [Bacteroidales bacterium]
MKKALIFIALTTFSFNSFAQQQDHDTIISNNPANLKVQVLYFHITNRCGTCRGIEANVRKTIETWFSMELDSGIVELHILNCELPENKQKAEKYEAYGATLALTVYKDGVELNTYDITDWAFQKAHNPDLFIAELKAKIEAYIR